MGEITRICKSKIDVTHDAYQSKSLILFPETVGMVYSTICAMSFFLLFNTST